MKIWAIFPCSDLNFYWKSRSQGSEARNAQNENWNFAGLWGEGIFLILGLWVFRHHWNSEDLQNPEIQALKLIVRKLFGVETVDVFIRSAKLLS